MISARETAELAIDEVFDEVARRLATNGWRRRQLDRSLWETFTNEMDGPAETGVTASVEVVPRLFTIGDQWPLHVQVFVGVGWEPALGLMPLLTLPPSAMLILSAATAGRGFIVELADANGVAEAADAIATYVNDHALGFASTYPDVATIEGALRRTAATCPEDGRQRSQELHMVVLAAMGRYEEATNLLAAYREAYTSSGPIDRERRFTRQLDRWLAHPQSPIPTAEDTLAHFPPTTRLRSSGRPSMRDERAQAKARQEAGGVVRARARDMSAASVRQLIVDEYGRRNIRVTPVYAAAAADTIVMTQRPFGRAEATVRGLWMAGETVVGLVRLFKEPPYEDPDWMRRPDRAGYPVPMSRDDAVAVDIAPMSRERLERARADGRRMGPAAQIPLWLTRDTISGATPAVQVHLGDAVVGTLWPEAAAAFRSYFREAELFDEDLAVTGQLIRTSDRIDILEVALPDPRRR